MFRRSFPRVSIKREGVRFSTTDVISWWVRFKFQGLDKLVDLPKASLSAMKHVAYQSVPGADLESQSSPFLMPCCGFAPSDRAEVAKSPQSNQGGSYQNIVNAVDLFTRWTLDALHRPDASITARTEWCCDAITCAICLQPATRSARLQPASRH